MITLKRISFRDAVLVGNCCVKSFSSDNYKMTLEGDFIGIADEHENIVFSHISNVVWFTKKKEPIPTPKVEIEIDKPIAKKPAGESVIKKKISL